MRKIKCAVLVCCAMVGVAHAVPLDELASIPKSILAFNAQQQTPEALPSRDFNAYAQRLCQAPGYHCQAVTIGQTWAELFPDRHQREWVMRLNRTNVALKYRRWLLIPDQINVLHYMAASPLPVMRTATGHRQVVVSLSHYAFAAYDEQGRQVYWGPASGGMDQCPGRGGSCQSKTGHFHIYRRGGVNCRSSTYPRQTHGGAPMPYCMYYFRGFALHGSTLSGFAHRSVGCVRLFYDDARWLNEFFIGPRTDIWVVP